MASKKKKKKSGKKVKKTSGAPRACSDCGKLGHNKRSHEPGGKFG